MPKMPGDPPTRAGRDAERLEIEGLPSEHTVLKRVKKLFNRPKGHNVGEKMSKEKTSIIGKKIIVRANVAGVHAGVVESFDPANQTVTLTGAYRLWRFYTHDKSGSISDVCANGLKPKGGHSIGAKLKSVTVVNPPGLELAEMTDAAYESIENWKN